MYMWKEGNDVKFNISEMGRVIGVTQPTLSRIINRRVACRKVVAYCMTKYIDEKAEIEKYFDRVED